MNGPTVIIGSCFAVEVPDPTLEGLKHPDSDVVLQLVGRADDNIAWVTMRVVTGPYRDKVLNFVEREVLLIGEAWVYDSQSQADGADEIAGGDDVPEFYNLTIEAFWPQKHHHRVRVAVAVKEDAHTIMM